MCVRMPALVYMRLLSCCLIICWMLLTCLHLLTRTTRHVSVTAHGSLWSGGSWCSLPSCHDDDPSEIPGWCEAPNKHHPDHNSNETSNKKKKKEALINYNRIWFIITSSAVDVHHSVNINNGIIKRVIAVHKLNNEYWLTIHHWWWFIDP